MKITISHDVSFDETSFPFSSLTLSESELEISEFLEDVDSPDVGPSLPPQRHVLRLGPSVSSPAPASSPPTSSSAYDTARTSPSDSTTATSPTTTPPSRPTRDRRVPERYGDFGHVAFVSNITPPGEPLTYAQALASPESHHWKAAMQQELQSLADCKTWSLVPLPKDKHCIGSKWVFKLKYKSDGTIDRFKARLVAKGFSQVPGLDFGDTYAPTGRLGSLRLLIALASYYNWDFDQLDVVTAFLNGNLEEEIYMTPPLGLDGGNGLVCHLHQTLYGLRQSPNRWYFRLSTWLVSIGFVISLEDPCLFLKPDPATPCFLWVHVDDIAVFGKRTEWFKTAIKKEFKMVDHGPAHFLLAIRISRNPTTGTISLLQDQYLLSLLELFDMSSCRPASTPLAPNSHLLPATDDEVSEFEALGVSYRGIVGCLGYLSQCTRPELAYPCSILGQFLERPGITHWMAAKHVLRYLSGTRDFGLTYSRPSTIPQILGYSDSDWAACRFSRRSICGYVFIACGGAVSWRAKKQTSVASSSTEAEYRGLLDAGKEALWFHRVHKSIVPSLTATPTTLHCDNQAAIALTKSSAFRANTKHIEAHFHWIRDQVATSMITVPYCSTSEMAADIFTKPVERIKLERFCDMMGVGKCTVMGV